MTSFSDKLDEVLNKHSCYVCYDDWKSQRRKCSGVKEQIIKLVLDEVIGEDESLEDARYRARVVRDETNGTRHSIDPDAVLKAISNNDLRAEQRKKLLDESKQGDHK